MQMTQKTYLINEEINTMLKEKVVDLDTIMHKKGFAQNFIEHAQQKIINLSKNIFGDYTYEKKNRFPVESKKKILKYLKEKSMLISSRLKEETKKQFYDYDEHFFKKRPNNLALMKEMVLRGKSQVEAVQGNIQRLKTSRDYIRGQFLNQAAYQFDRERYCSMFWGILTASLINSTIYKKGSAVRKAALVLTIGHIFGQMSYHLNLDKYFDSVYAIYEEQAQVFMREQKKREQKENIYIKNKIQ